MYVFEKREEYQRKHNLTIKASALTGSVSEQPGALNGEWKEIQQRFLPNVSTKQMEEELRRFALKIGVIIKVNADISMSAPAAEEVEGGNGKGDGKRKSK